jgi:hypothetical protein
MRSILGSTWTILLWENLAALMPQSDFVSMMSFGNFLKIFWCLGPLTCACFIFSLCNSPFSDRVPLSLFPMLFLTCLHDCHLRTCRINSRRKFLSPLNLQRHDQTQDRFVLGFWDSASWLALTPFDLRCSKPTNLWAQLSGPYAICRDPSSGHHFTRDLMGWWDNSAPYHLHVHPVGQDRHLDHQQPLTKV